MEGGGQEIYTGKMDSEIIFMHKQYMEWIEYLDLGSFVVLFFFYKLYRVFQCNFYVVQTVEEVLHRMDEMFTIAITGRRNHAIFRTLEAICVLIECFCDVLFAYKFLIRSVIHMVDTH